MGHIYDEHFMDYTGDSSRHSAMVVAGLLRAPLDIGSVLDVGCATGTWLRAWSEAGVGDIQGVDGDYVDRSRLRIDGSCFRSADLSRPLSLGRRFDLVQSLEVAEHIDGAHADQFVQNLVDHSHGLILFSAAPPGQGGEYHVNEQPLEYWREKFAARGYRAFDAVRPSIAADPSISFWYRYNVLLYVRDDRIGDLPATMMASRIADDRAIPDPTPPLFRIRKALVRALPYGMQQGLARLKARMMSGRSKAS
jgi:SAM-dependent methyltransferase